MILYDFESLSDSDLLYNWFLDAEGALCFCQNYHIVRFKENSAPTVHEKDDYSIFAAKKVVKVSKVTLQLEAELNPDYVDYPNKIGGWYIEDESIVFVTEQNEKISLYIDEFDSSGDKIVSCQLETEYPLDCRPVRLLNTGAIFTIR